MDFISVVRGATNRLDFLDQEGRLTRLDSLAIIDLFMDLETTLKIEIPITELRQENFESIETIGQMLERLAAPK